MNIRCFYLFVLMCHLPLSGYFFPFGKSQKPFLLIIASQGNNQNPGRTIDDSFESEISINFAYALRDKIMARSSLAKVMIQKSDNLQAAQFANKLDTDLYLDISACKHANGPSGFSLYQFTYHENSIIKDNGLSFFPIDQIYLVNQARTSDYLQIIVEYCKQLQATAFKGYYKLPYKPLLAVKAPSIGIELLLHTKTDWTLFVDCIAQGIVSLIEKRS